MIFYTDYLNIKLNLENARRKKGSPSVSFSTEFVCSVLHVKSSEAKWKHE